MKRHLPLVVPAAVAVVVILLTSIVQGIWTERWGANVGEQVRAFAAGIDAIPLIVGDWEAPEIEEEPTDLERQQLNAAGAVGHLSRTYRNPKTGDAVSVYMISGASRNVAVHTPDACYPGAGFRMEGDSKLFSIQTGSTSAEFRTAVFLKEEPTGSQRLRIFWAWNAHGTWEAPTMPRLRYGGRTALNKIYLISQAPPGETAGDSPVIEFAERFLPLANAKLFPEKHAAGESEPAADQSEEAPAETGATGEDEADETEATAEADPAGSGEED
jgi:hypothetical protein